jgi:RNA polymerase sigma-54 factor
MISSALPMAHPKGRSISGISATVFLPAPAPISTISRATISKYVQTPFGIFPLRYFFSDGITNAEGEEVSVKEVHNILRELVAAEDKASPLTDEQLVEALAQRGFKVARRTIAKYRDQLHTPVARMRR